MIKGKRVCVTGGAGSIGSELVRQLAVSNKVFILDLSERAYILREQLKKKGYWVHSRVGDVRDQSTIADVFEDFKPQVIFHAAALKHVTPNEEYAIEAIKTNIIGTYNVIYEAKKWDCFEKFIFISTDKVVNARTKMGITKLCAESLVVGEGKKFTAVRFGNVMGSDGSLFQIWQEQTERGEPLTVTDERMERYMMTIPEACKLVIEAAEIGKGGEIIAMEMGKRIKIIELAQQLVDQLRYEPGIEVVGIRPGESLSEELMTTDEQARAVQQGKFYIIK